MASDQLPPGSRKPERTPFPTRRQLSLFLRKIRIGAPDACWNWCGLTNNHGYGRCRVGDGAARRLVYVHRLAYSLWNDTDLEDMTVDHTCRNTLCCNPAHLQECTNEENAAKRWARENEDNETDYVEEPDDTPF